MGIHRTPATLTRLRFHLVGGLDTAFSDPWTPMENFFAPSTIIILKNVLLQEVVGSNTGSHLTFPNACITILKFTKSIMVKENIVRNLHNPGKQFNGACEFSIWNGLEWELQLVISSRAYIN